METALLNNSRFFTVMLNCRDNIDCFRKIRKFSRGGETLILNFLKTFVFKKVDIF